MGDIKPEILELYKNKKYDVMTSVETIQEDKEVYEALTKYFAKEISFDKFMEYVDSYCPDNSCHWCNDNCDKCDLHPDKCEVDDVERCRICWQRCLNKNVGGN